MEFELTDFEAEAYHELFTSIVPEGEASAPAMAAADLFRASLLPSITLKAVRRLARVIRPRHASLTSPGGRPTPTHCVGLGHGAARGPGRLLAV